MLDQVLGEVLPRDIEVELRDHLSLCPSCRRQFEEYEAAWRSLDGLKDIRFPESNLPECSPAGGGKASGY